MAGNRVTPEIQAKIATAVLDEYRSMEEVAREFGVAGSTVARYAAIEREGRKRAVATAKAMPPTVVVEKDAKLIAMQGTTIKELREENEVFKTAFDAIRNILVEVENRLDK